MSGQQLDSFYNEFRQSVATSADVENTYLPEAFTRLVSETLAEGGEFGDITTVNFNSRGRTNKPLSVSGYDLDSGDDSISLIVTRYFGSPVPVTVNTDEVRSLTQRLENFVRGAFDDSVVESQDPSHPAVQLAIDLKNLGSSISSIKLYLFTDGVFGSRLKDLPPTTVSGLPVHFHLWDINRIQQVYESTIGREALEIFLPSPVPCLQISENDQFATYLAAMPGPLLADLYQEYGNRLLESNVRSYLSNRGKVNKGIRETINAVPERFVVYNNGVTATALDIKFDGSGRITGFTDLQIVNGGQTVASLFYSRKNSLRKSDLLENVTVPIKIISVDSSLSNELVPNISRYSNSQNAVSSADFFSNSPFHIRIEELSRRIIAPATGTATYGTFWYYERTRGQYMNDRNRKASMSDVKKFDLQNPRKQMFTKVDLARWWMSWEMKPHTASLGAQKNFAKFAEVVGPKWERDSSQYNERFFKQSVALGIMYQSIRSLISKAPWYDGGFLINTVIYALAKLRLITTKVSGKTDFDLEKIWRLQVVPDDLAAALLRIAEQVRAVLLSDTRRLPNVSEWAKTEECWRRVKELSVQHHSLEKYFVSANDVKKELEDASAKQKTDDGIRIQTLVVTQTPELWRSLENFLLANGRLSPLWRDLIRILISPNGRVLSERQSRQVYLAVQEANRLGWDEVVFT